MQALAEMKELDAYNRWAKRLILDAVEDLSASELSRFVGSRVERLLGPDLARRTARYMEYDRLRPAAP